ncbi:amidohydrolase family protein [Kutzneria sp. CA-103260]|uniref:amidohydrolase family protein n=1 Tax=Kutzneria sp. CA-103260 TaxID=2802641 RepID=UPI001BAC1C78|nr:amidohydrolase family protein [Kutzneria sp. CA-103260]QUQ64746.1 TRZ/ATZ family hydrolase [Kutzneria sp. CA-103260]
MRTLLSGGTVISMDPAVGDLGRGDVLITDGVITEVAARIDAPDAEVIDATDRIVLPGFVDTHRHTWQTAFRGIGADWTFAEYRTAMHGTLKPHYSPEDIYLGNLLGRLEALNSGVTTMLDWFHANQSPEHADAAWQGLKDAPARSVFALCAGAGPDRPVDEAELGRFAADGLVTLALAWRGPQLTTMDIAAADLRLAGEVGLRTSVHVGSGGARGSRPVSAMREHGLLHENTTFIHANGVEDDELRMLADAGCSVSISPDVEVKMGFGWPETGRMLAAGLRPTFSIDDCPSAGGDMFATLRTAFAVQRGLDGSLNSRDLLEFATVDGARACGLFARTGSLTPGKDADIVLLRADDLSVFPFNNPAGTIVAAGHPGLVDTVVVAGRVVKRDGALVGVDLPTLRSRILESRNRIAAAAGIPLDGSWRPRTESE